jgi:hypothetical protein
MKLPGTASWRRRVALGFLLLGTVVASRAISSDLPHEQSLIFRLPEEARHAPLKLTASFVRVGESEPRAGLSVTRDGREIGDIHETVRLPNGDYVVTIEWEHVDTSEHGVAREDKEDETSRVERVTLSGGELVVSMDKRVLE